MKNLTVTLALALLTLPATLACPVKAGKISNGLMPIPSGLKAECGMNYQIYAAMAKKGSDGALTWYELYKASSAQNKAAIKTLETLYKKKGFTLYSHDKDSESEEIIYVNNRTKKLMQMQLIKIDGADYLGVVGN